MQQFSFENNMLGINVRNATKSDCELMWNMIKELATFHKEPDNAAIDENVLLEDGFGENPWYFFLIAEVTVDGIKKPAGFVLYHRAYSTWHGKAFYIEEIYVREEYRKRNVGTEILKEITRRALKEGVNKIRWCAFDWNKQAHQFYKKVGAKMSDDWVSLNFERNAMESFIQS